jgi:hypothetical protein
VGWKIVTGHGTREALSWASCRICARLSRSRAPWEILLSVVHSGVLLPEALPEDQVVYGALEQMPARAQHNSVHAPPSGGSEHFNWTHDWARAR